MSVSVMSEVFKRYTTGGNEMLLALALADHADDDGLRIYPSVQALARKIRVSERTVQTLLKNMIASGWLVLVKHSDGGRGRTRHYRISPQWLKGEDIAPFDRAKKGEDVAPFSKAKGEIVAPFTVERVKTGAQKGAVATAPEPSVEPSVEISGDISTEDGREPRDGIEWDGSQKIFTGISAEMMESWERAYRAVDVDAELTKMELWYEANPRRRKRNIARFITGWLGREQDQRSRQGARVLVGRARA